MISKFPAFPSSIEEEEEKGHLAKNKSTSNSTYEQKKHRKENEERIEIRNRADYNASVVQMADCFHKLLKLVDHLARKRIQLIEEQTRHKRHQASSILAEEIDKSRKNGDNR